MSVINPRNRLINFRLSEVEFEKLKAACRRQGARSISEFARGSVLRVLDDPTGANELAPGRVRNLGHKVTELEIRVEQLLRLLSGAEGTVPEPAPGPIAAAAGGEHPHGDPVEYVLP